MAFVGEAVVGKICEMAIEAAVQQLVKEARLVVNFREDFEWLNVNLTYLRGFLTDAGEQSKQNAAVKKWLQKIQDASMQAEDIVEECAVESLYSDSTQSCVLSCNQMIFRHRMGRKIKDVKDRISSIIEDADLLKVGRDILSPVPASSSALQRGAEWRRSSLLPIDSHPVGIDSKVDYIASLLDKSVHPVIAVVGMGGMGKTYLLQHVYNKTNQRFEISIWLSISQSYSIRNLQYDIANYIGLSKEIVEGKVSEQVAAQSIHAKLQGKKCLIVLDDVWKPVMEENLIERLGFSNNCKIVITTRNKDVCRHVDAEIYEMEYLSEEDSWELFCVYGFPHCEANRPPQHIKEVACNIVKECGKLPLAIKMTAASLSHTTLSREWAYKLRQLTEVSDLNDPMKILKLSYDCLPAHLKACFAYFCFFCEDEKIDVEYLVNLWIGEGFISEEIDQWDVGLSYLYEIADLCLVQVWEELWKGANELKKYCRVHDLLLDLAMYICKENKCAFDAQHAFTKGSSPEISGGWYRILLPKKNIGDDVVAHSRPAGSGPRLLRTLSLYGNDINNIPANMFVNMRTLRVLDLSSNHISIMPDCVGEMKLLKVLNLSHTGLREIPRCVRRLKSLRFLDASGFKLPVWIGELKCLEHIAFEYATVMPLKGISKLSSLRILRSSSALRIPFRNDESLSLEDVSNMIQLQEIGIRFDDESQWKGIEGGILGRLVKMRHFTLFNSMQMGSDLPIFPENLKAMADLEKLEIDYFAVTSCLCSFANLRELRLISCQWTNYPEFEKLPNLVNLYLNGNASCTELPKAFGKKSGFPKLRFLAVDYFYQLEEFPELEDGAMPCLELIILWGCDELKKVPEGLELLKSLKEFSYFNTGTRELRERLKEGGQDWHKIKAHNPHVIIRG